ncbi:MAG TPA: DUF1573 domain-containing protein [Pirellulales bacterium]|nr:DUF1573 domain-containing protein [Pirellulales bacterium]
MRDSRHLLLACGATTAVFLFSWLTIREYRANVPKLACDKPAVDLGQIRWGKYEAVFTLRNNARHPMTLTGVRKSCDCAEVELSPARLGPDESATLRCTWDTTGKRRQSRTDLIVGYRLSEPDAEESAYVLTVAGNVTPDYDWDREEVAFTRGKSEIATIRFKPVAAESVRLISAYSSHAAFEAVARDKTTLEVRFYPDKWRDGRGGYSVVAKLANSALSTRRFPIRVLQSRQKPE